MSVEFRQRTPGEYARIVWRRKWLIILPTIAVATAIAWVVWRLPNVYQSTTLLIVQPATIPNALVPALSEVDLTMRINNISQLVLSRTSLEPLILKYRLYEEERKSGWPMEYVIDEVRKSIIVNIVQSREVTNAFSISVRDRTRENARNVAQEIAGKYVSGQTEDSVRASNQTDIFFQEQLGEAKRQLDDTSQRSLLYMQQNVKNLPTGSGSLIGQLGGMHERQKALITEIGRMRERESIMDTQLNDLAAESQKEKEDILQRAEEQPKDSPLYAQLMNRKIGLDAQLKKMLTTLRPENPDVKDVQAELDVVQREMDEIVAAGQAKVKKLKDRIERAPDNRIKNMQIQLQLLRSEIARMEKFLGETNSGIADLSSRLSLVPGAELGLINLNREYEMRKTQYDELLAKQRQAKMANQVQMDAKGEKIQVVDPASMPQKPVAPNRAVLMLMGLALGLAIGGAFAAAVEVPRLLTIQTSDDAQHYTGLPVLASVPELLTPQESRRITLRRALLTAAGVVITVMSIPAIALILKFTRALEFLVS